MKSHQSSFLSVLFLLAGAIGNLLIAQNLYLRAPDVVPGTLPEMRQTSYWVEKMTSPDGVVLTTGEIETMNEAYSKRMKEIDQLDSSVSARINKQLTNRPGLMTLVPDINMMSSKQLFEWVQAKIAGQIEYLRSRAFGKIMAIEYSESELAFIGNEITNLKNDEQVSIRFGITTTESRLHIIPPIRPEYKGMFTSGKARWDLWTLDVLPIGTPVKILQTSSSGAFLFILSDRGYGWVSSNLIAIGSENEISNYQDKSNFIVCTGDWVPFYTDSSCSIASGWLRMGNSVPTQEGNPRLIKVPVRNTNGTFSIEVGWLKPDADVHPGYLPYTSRNVAEQAFKLLDNMYDWTGAWYGRNHMTNPRDIFSCFGFKLPSNGNLLAVFGDPYSINPDVGRDAQLETIFSNRPFLTLQVCENSHSQMYLGNHEGMPIVFDAHGYGYKNENGEEMELKRWIVSTIEMPDYFLKQEITFIRMY